MTTDTTDNAVETLRHVIEVNRLNYPQLGLSFGYFGNYGHWGDDRCWCVFTKLSSTPAASACNISWGYANTEDVNKLADPARMAQLENWLAATAARLAAGELHQIGAERWLAAEIAHAARHFAGIQP